jgi:hypothetical protein
VQVTLHVHLQPQLNMSAWLRALILRAKAVYCAFVMPCHLAAPAGLDTLRLLAGLCLTQERVYALDPADTASVSSLQPWLAAERL